MTSNVKKSSTKMFLLRGLRRSVSFRRRTRRTSLTPPPAPLSAQPSSSSSCCCPPTNNNESREEEDETEEEEATSTTIIVVEIGEDPSCCECSIEDNINIISTTTDKIRFNNSNSNKQQQQQKQQSSDVTTKVITGVIIIPDQCFHKNPSINVALQDTSRIDRQPITIASHRIQPSNISEGEKIHFALSYKSSDAIAIATTQIIHEWYTLQVRVEDSSTGELLCFNHRVTRAIDDIGQPIQKIQIPLIYVAAPVAAAVKKDNDDENRTSSSQLNIVEAEQ